MDARRALPEIALPEVALAIADLHLDVARADDAGAAALERFLDAMRGHAGALVVLGDLFDAWVGPAQARMPGAPRVLDALASIAKDGVELLVVPGNRDFLLDASFARRTGARILAEGFVARSPGPSGRRTLFVHGDTLCTRDAAYLRLRRVLRSAPVQWVGPRLPLWVGTAIARRLRRASVQAIAKKLPDEKSVQPSAADRLAREHAAELLVCGHAHAFRDETLACGARWIVLDAFETHGSAHGARARDVLRVRASGADVLESRSLAATMRDAGPATSAQR